jgi:hypothetical protein
MLRMNGAPGFVAGVDPCLKGETWGTRFLALARKFLDRLCKIANMRVCIYISRQMFDPVKRFKNASEEIRQAVCQEIEQARGSD